MLSARHWFAFLAARLQRKQTSARDSVGLGMEDSFADPDDFDECCICFETYEMKYLCSAKETRPAHKAGENLPGTCGGSGRPCPHRLCSACMWTYVAGALKDRTYPVPCTMGASACGHVFDHDTLAELLGQGSPELDQLQQLEAEASIDPRHRLYCPHKDCSELLARPEDGTDLPRDQVATCPACHRGFCPHCMVPGWHEGYSCAQFQALPPHQRSVADAAVLQLAQEKGWKHCPGCKYLVGRTEGCNHMHCLRCGTHFCYACGAAYSEGRRPTCRCRLF